MAEEAEPVTQVPDTVPETAQVPDTVSKEMEVETLDPEIAKDMETAKDIEIETIETAKDIETIETAKDMETENGDDDAAAVGGKRQREEAVAADESEETENGEGKKQKVEKSVEEERLEKSDADEEKGTETAPQVSVSLGPKSFKTSQEMFDYFHKLLHSWSPNFNLNKYEHLVLLDLLKKGHPEPEKKIGKGVHSFQVRSHPKYRSRCFFLVRENGSFDDLSFRKYVDHILPLPENMQLKPEVNKALGGGRGGGGGGGRGGGRGNWRGRGRGGKPRN